MEQSEIVLHGHQVSYRMAGRGPLLVLLHGIAGSSATWEEVLPRLGEGHTVLAPDLLGHGESSKPEGDYSLGAYANAVRDLLEALQAPAGDDRRALARRRHSNAARLPVPRALRAPRAGVERWPRPGAPRDAARGSAPRGRGGAPLALRGRAAQRRPYGARSREPRNCGRARSLEETWRSFVSLKEPEARRAFLRTVRGLIDLGGQRVSTADRLYLTAGVPTLIVWGARDPLIPVRHAHEAHARIEGSRLEILPGAGHFPHRDAPQRFVSALLELRRGGTAPLPPDPKRLRRRLRAGPQPSLPR